MTDATGGTTTTGTTTTGTTTTGTTTTGTEKPWFDTFDAETKGYLQNKGLDKKTALEAVVEISKFHREAEKFVGAPANELLRLPKDPNAPEWKGVYERLGKPKEATEYDFASVKRAGDKPLDQALTDTLRQAAFDSNMSKEAATRLAANVVKHLDGVESATAADKAAALATEKKSLNDNWGVNAAANMVVAKAAAAALGVSPEAVAALESVVGYSKIMEMFRTIGTKIGEDRFVQSSGGQGNVMTRDQAVAEKNALKADKNWVTRYINGGVEEKKKMDALDRIIVGIS